MAARPFHMGWFVGGGFSVKAWSTDWAGTNARDRATGELIIDVARSLDRACFDYVIVEDSSNVPYTHGGTSEAYLKQVMSVMKNDPAPLIPLMGQATSHIGLIPTLSVTEYPPFLLARLVNTLDHLTRGRAGWNIVTGSNDGGAQNYGMDKQIEHDLRYEMADEFFDLVCQLLESWEPDAVIMDRENGVFVDHTKVHPVNFEGRFYKCRGPLNSMRSPQVRPVFCQAGGSPRGRDFAARSADTIIAHVNSIEAMKEYRADVRQRLERFGRKPDDCKVMFVLNPVFGETDDEAQRKYERALADINANLEPHIAELSRTTGNDLSVYDLDEPLPAIDSNGHRSHAAYLVGRTLREVAGVYPNTCVPVVGSPATVAAKMDEIMQEVEGDGFLMINRWFSRRYVAEVVDGLVPELQRRGLTRTSYTFDHFRDNLLEF